MGMIAAIVEAQAALAIGNSAVDMVSANRRFTHWSMYCLLLGCVAGTATAVAVAILGQYALSVVVASMTIVCGIGAFYIKRFGLVESLEKLIKSLAQKIQEMYKNVLNLEQTKQSLDQTIKMLNEQQKINLVERERLQKELDGSIKKSGNLIDKFKKNVDLKKLAELHKQSKQTADLIFNRAVLYLKTVKDVQNSKDPDKDALEQAANDVSTIDTSLNTKAGTMKDELFTYAKWAKALADLTEFCKLKDEKLEKLSKNATSLSNSANTLEKLTGQTSEDVEKMKSIVTKLKQTNQQDEDSNKGVNKLLSSFS